MNKEDFPCVGRAPRCPAAPRLLDTLQAAEQIRLLDDEVTATDSARLSGLCRSPRTTRHEGVVTSVSTRLQRATPPSSSEYTRNSAALPTDDLVVDRADRRLRLGIHHHERALTTATRVPLPSCNVSPMRACLRRIGLGEVSVLMLSNVPRRWHEKIRRPVELSVDDVSAGSGNRTSDSTDHGCSRQDPRDPVPTLNPTVAWRPSVRGACRQARARTSTPRARSWCARPTHLTCRSVGPAARCKWPCTLTARRSRGCPQSARAFPTGPQAIRCSQRIRLPTRLPLRFVSPPHARRTPSCALLLRPRRRSARAIRAERRRPRCPPTHRTPRPRQRQSPIRRVASSVCIRKSAVVSLMGTSILRRPPSRP